MYKKKFKLKYPKLLLLILTFVITYLIFKQQDFTLFHNLLLPFGLLGSFLAGIFFSYGFTAAPAIAVLLILAKEQNLLLTGLIAGLGALIGDLIIFKFIKYSFADEIEKLSQEKSINNFNHHLSKKLKKYLLAILGGFIIASPLPDEIGVSLLAACKCISIKYFSIMSYLLNTAGILIILLIGK